MGSLFDQVEKGLEDMVRKAREVLDTGRLQLDLMGLRREQDAAARDLGLLAWQRARGADVSPDRFEALHLRLDDLAARIAGLERQLEEARAGVSTPGGASGSAPAAPGGGSPEAPPVP